MKNKLPLLLSLLIVNAFAQDETEGMRAMRLSCEKHKVGLGCFNYANMIQRREIGDPEKYFKLGCEYKHQPSCSQEKWDLPALETTAKKEVEIPADVSVEEKKTFEDTIVIKNEEPIQESPIIEETALPLQTDEMIDGSVAESGPTELEKRLEAEKTQPPQIQPALDAETEVIVEEVANTETAKTSESDSKEATPSPSPASVNPPAYGVEVQGMVETFSSDQPATTPGDSFSQPQSGASAETFNSPSSFDATAQ